MPAEIEAEIGFCRVNLNCCIIISVNKIGTIGFLAPVSVRRSLAGILFAALVMLVFAGHSAFGEESFDCAAECEQGTRHVLELCRKNHAKNPAECPSDDGRILDECRRVCAELSGKSPEDLQKLLPPNYNDILEGK